MRRIVPETQAVFLEMMYSNPSPDTRVTYSCCAGSEDISLANVENDAGMMKKWEGRKRGREKEAAMWSVLKLRNSADIKKSRPRPLSASVRSACSDAMQVRSSKFYISGVSP